MIEYDANGLTDGMTPAEYQQIGRFINEVDHADWFFWLGRHDRPNLIERAQAPLAEAATTFGSFTQAQRDYFLSKFRPMQPLTSIIPLLVAFNLAGPAPTA
jgi:hypothetical protein